MIVTKITLSYMGISQSHEDAIAVAAVLAEVIRASSSEYFEAVAESTHSESTVKLTAMDVIAACTSYVRHIARTQAALKTYTDAIEAAHKGHGEKLPEVKGSGTVQ